jgi:hypothetical protein
VAGFFTGGDGLARLAFLPTGPVPSLVGHGLSGLPRFALALVGLMVLRAGIRWLRC